jgi:hypothetical protein
MPTGELPTDNWCIYCVVGWLWTMNWKGCRRRQWYVCFKILWQSDARFEFSRRWRYILRSSGSWRRVMWLQVPTSRMTFLPPSLCPPIRYYLTTTLHGAEIQKTTNYTIVTFPSRNWENVQQTSVSLRIQTGIQDLRNTQQECHRLYLDVGWQTDMNCALYIHFMQMARNKIPESYLVSSF